MSGTEKILTPTKENFREYLRQHMVYEVRIDQAKGMIEDGVSVAEATAKVIEFEKSAYNMWLDVHVRPWCARHRISLEQCMSVVFDDSPYNPENPSKDLVTIDKIRTWSGQEGAFYLRLVDELKSKSRSLITEESLHDLDNKPDARSKFSYTGNHIGLDILVARSGEGLPYEMKVSWGSRGNLTQEEAEEFNRALAEGLRRAKDNVDKRNSLDRSKELDASVAKGLPGVISKFVNASGIAAEQLFLCNMANAPIPAYVSALTVDLTGHDVCDFYSETGDYLGFVDGDFVQLKSRTAMRQR